LFTLSEFNANRNYQTNILHHNFSTWLKLSILKANASSSVSIKISLFSLVIVLGGEGIQLLTLVGVSVKIKDKQRNTSLTSRALEEFAENFIT